MFDKLFFIRKWIQKTLDSTAKEKMEKTIILFLVGLFILIAVPTKDSNKKIPNAVRKQENTEKRNVEQNDHKDAYIELMENKLEEIIEGMEGAGTTSVMITLKNHGEKILDKNQPYENETQQELEGTNEKKDSRIKSEQETVLLEQDGNTVPFVIMECYPKIEGVVVVCEGGDNKELALHIKEAVQALFEIDAHKVCVCKKS